MNRRPSAKDSPSILTIGVYALVGGLLVLGQLVPGTTHQVAGGEMLPQTLLWLLAAAILATEHLMATMVTIDWLSIWGVKDNTLHRSISNAKLNHRWQGLVILVVAFASLAWLAISTWHVEGRGNMRYAINSAWYAVGTGAALWVLVTIMRSALVSRMIFAILIGLAWLSTVSGFYQVGISLPADLELYRKNPTEVHQKAGIEAAPGTAAYLQFESRLQDIVPLGPFSLTNSLAGFLATWIVLLIALGWRRDVWRSAPWRVALGLLVFASLGWCVILTKSRAAWLAILIGIVVVMVGSVVTDEVSRRRMRRAFQGRRLSMTLFLSAMAIFSVFLLVSAWDDKIWSEAWKSLTFRGEYWRATAGMIQENPIYGVGLGNFQNYYSAFKPQLASETVVDPHNFLLDVAGTLGLPGLVLLVIALLYFARIWLADLFQEATRAIHATTVSSNQEKTVELLVTSQQSRSAIKATTALYIGAFVGAMALWIGNRALGNPPDPFPFCLGFPFVAVALTMDFAMTLRSPGRLIESRSLSLGLGASLIAWCVHLSASSGWLSPGLMNSAIALVAGYAGVRWRRSQLKASTGEEQSPDKHRTMPMMLVAAFAWMLLVFYYFTAWAPRQNVAMIQAEAMQAGLTEPRALAMQAADRWNPIGSTWLAEIRTVEAENGVITTGAIQPDQIKRVESAYRELIALDHANPLAWAQIGHWSLRLAPFRRESLQQANDAYQEALQRDPHDTSLLLQVALTSWLLEDFSKARDCLQRIAWNEQNIPHADCKLAAASIFWPPQLGPTSKRVPPSDWQAVRQSDQMPRGWVRAAPVFSFLEKQLPAETTIIR